MHDKIDKIAALIYKSIVRDISKSEKKDLDAWKSECEGNLQLFQKITQPDFLKEEYVRYKSVHAEKAAADMKRRIRELEPVSCCRKNKIRPWYYTAAATFLLLGGIAVTMFYYDGKEEKHVTVVEKEVVHSQIRHGKVQAVLTFDNGVSVELGADSIKNMEVFNHAMIANREAYNNMPKGGAEVRQSPRILDLSTPRGGEFKLVLSDGTEIWLNAESRLLYPETFEGSERRVKLYGEAYFKVAKNADKPFVVESSGQEIRVTGTEFNVHNYKEEADIYTTLVNGSVILRARNAENNEEHVLLPGQQAVYNKASRDVDIKTVDINMAVCWKNGKFVFDDQTLEQIMCTLSRWYDFTYEFKSEKVRKTLFMGSIPRYGEFGDVARILEASGGLHFEQDGKNVRIFRK